MADTKPLVAAVKTPDYEPVVIRKSIAKIFDLLGRTAPNIIENKTVVLKPNLLMAAEPEKAITTNPEIVRAVAETCTAKSATVKIVDSPGSGTPWSEKSLRKVYEKCGFLDIASEDVNLNYYTSTRKIDNPSGKLIKSFELIETALDADVMINLAKAKTHTFAFMTCAVKNLFGLIPGFDKPGYHSRMKNAENFSEMLIDLFELVKPSLSIVDAVVGMEGDGPTSGNPREMKLILASTDANALDTVVAHLMGYSPVQVPLIAAAVRRGLTTGKIEDIEIVGDTNLAKPVPDFKLPRTAGGTGLASGGWLVGLLEPLLRKMWILEPVASRKLCVGCGACVDACPNVAIEIKEGKAKIARDQCIRCYCCHEACPHGAMKLKRSILYRLFHKVTR